MRQDRAVRIVEFPGDAPFIAAERRRATCQSDGRFVEVGNLAFGIGRVDRRGNGREQFLHLPFALLEFPLCFLALRDVARDLRCANDPAHPVAHRRDSQRDIHKASVLASPNRFIVNALAAPQASKDARLFILPIGGN